MAYEVGDKINATGVTLSIEILSFMPGAQSLKKNKENEYAVSINGSKTVFGEGMLKNFLDNAGKVDVIKIKKGEVK